MVGTGRHHVVGREPRKATGACEAVLPVQELSGLRSLPQPHPSTSVRVTIAPSSNLAEETKLRGTPARSAAPSAELRHDGARGIERATSDTEKMLSHKGAKSTYV